MNALLLVDIQNDFLPGGALAVPEGDQVVPIANHLIPQFELVIATQDWHPADHASFAASHPGRSIGDVIDLDGLQQILWPVHCVQGSSGAEFAPGLNVGAIDHIVQKGQSKRVDSYSGFFDNGRRNATGLSDYLRARNVDRVFIQGLATDYCVKFTALDARSLGIETSLIQDGCRGVDLQPGDVDKAMADMESAGVRIIRAKDVDAIRAR